MGRRRAPRPRYNPAAWLERSDDERAMVEVQFLADVDLVLRRWGNWARAGGLVRLGYPEPGLAPRERERRRTAPGELSEYDQRMLAVDRMIAGMPIYLSAPLREQLLGSGSAWSKARRCGISRDQFFDRAKQARYLIKGLIG